jgi:amino acid permease
MIMKRTISLFLILSACWPIISQSQSREMGIMFGVMGYKGDLDPNMYDTRFVDPAIGILYRRSYSNHWAFKAAFNYGHVRASDDRGGRF